MAGRRPRWRRDATRTLVRRGPWFRFAGIGRGPELVRRRGPPGRAPLGRCVRPDAAPAQRPPVRRHRRGRADQARGPSGRPVLQAPRCLQHDQPTGRRQPSGRRRLRQRWESRARGGVRVPDPGGAWTRLRAANDPAAEARPDRLPGRDMVDLVMTGDSYDEAAAAALAHARSTGATLIPAFDAVSTVVGQATVALEILEQLDSPPDVVVLPVGGGGLLAGCATWLRIHSPNTRIVGVEPAGAANMAPAPPPRGPGDPP